LATLFEDVSLNKPPNDDGIDGPATAGARRKAYEKPQLRRFSLKAEEVLVDNCKTASGGTGVAFQAPGCSVGGCFTAGS
jgi:hypothetical protein